MNKKILFFHDKFPCGGAERVTVDIADYIAAYDYETYVVTKTKSCESSNIVTIELPDKSDSDTLVNADFIIDTINSLAVDLFVLPISPLKHLEYILSRTHCKLVFAPHSTPLWEITAKIAAKYKRSRKTFLKRLEWAAITYPKAVWFNKYDKPFIQLHKNIYQLADVYAVLCDDYKRELIERLGLSAVDNKICVLPNSEKVVEEVNLNKKKQVIYVGRMTYEDKRVDRLIDIWGMISKKVPDWELILIGDGVERKTLQEKAKQKKLQRVNFIGHSSDVQKYYRDASVLCLTSTFEGWGLCLTEAQANGVVPLAFNCSAGVREILSPSGTNGYLIPPFDMKEYAHALLSLLNDSTKLQEMRQNVILKSKDYAPDVIGAKWLALFDEMTKP